MLIASSPLQLETSCFQEWDFIPFTLTLKSGFGFQSKHFGTCMLIILSSASLASSADSRKGAGVVEPVGIVLLVTSPYKCCLRYRPHNSLMIILCTIFQVNLQLFRNQLVQNNRGVEETFYSMFLLLCMALRASN